MTRKLHLSWFSGLFVLLASANAGVGQTHADAQGTDSSSQLIVMIDGELDGAPSTGAGLIFGRDANKVYVVTANHVVRRGGQGAQKLRILFKKRPEHWVSAQLAPEADPSPPGGLDLAVLAVAGIEQFGFDVCSLALDRLGNADGLARGAAVYAMGYPNGAAWGASVAPDLVAELVGASVNFQSAFIARGHSGGALLNDTGDIVGLIRLDQPPFGVATRIARVMEVLQRWHYPVKLRTVGTPSPLFVAVRNHARPELEQLLREPCAKVNERFEGQTPLQAAADSGAAEIAAALLKAQALTDPPSGDPDHDETFTPLQLAARRGHLEAVKVLLRAHANLEANRGPESWRRETALELAIWEGHREVALALRAAGAKTDFLRELKTGSPRRYALHEAAERASVEPAKLLIELGADVNALNSDGATPLSGAVEASNAAMVRVLLSAGAKPSVMDGSGNTPLSNAIVAAWQQAGKEKADARRETTVHVVQMLAKAAADLIRTKDRGEGQMTALGLATSYGQVDLVEVLLASGADVNQGDGRGRTALHHAAEVVASYGDAARYRAAQLSLIALLLKKGAKVNARDASGDPPLCRALSGDPANPRITVVEMLLKAGAQPLLPEDCKRHDGRSWAPDSHIEALIRSYSRKAK